MKIAILTLALTCLGQSYEKVSVLGNNYVVFKPRKAGIPLPTFRISSDSCGFLGTMTSYPKPGALGDLNGTRKCFDFCFENNYTAASCQSNSCKCLIFVPKDKQTLPVMTVDKSYKKVSSSSGKEMVVFTLPKAGTPPTDLRKISSVSERCSNQGFLTSYPQPGTLGDSNGTRKCFDYCYSLSFKGAYCLKNYCMCLAYNPTAIPSRSVSEETLSRSYQKVSTGGKDMVVFTPPKRGTPPLQKEKSISVSERCSVRGYLTSYPQPGTLGDLNGTRKCYDYCYSLSFKAAYCLEYSCRCLTSNPTD
jgi:hypothetical protein